MTSGVSCAHALLTLLLLICALPSQASAQDVSLEAAKKEGKVSVYGTIIPQVMNLIEKGFEAKYGVNIEYWRGDATKVIDRVLTEWRAGKPGFDMVIGARGPLSLAKADGVYAKFTPGQRGEFSGQVQRQGRPVDRLAHDAGGYSLSTRSWLRPPTCPRVSTICSIPNGKARSACPILRATPARRRISGTCSKIKGDKWMDFVRALAKQRPLLVESYSSVPNAIVRGEASLGITYIQYAGQTKGPIGFAPIDQVFRRSERRRP